MTGGSVTAPVGELTGERSSSEVMPLYLELGGGPAFLLRHQPSAVEAPGEATASGTAVLLCPPFGWEEVCSYRSRRAWAEDLAARGHLAARLDFPGSGDSAGSPRDPGRVQAWTDAVAAAAEWLGSQAGVTRVAVIGIGLGGLIAVAARAQGAPIDELVLWAVPGRGRAVVRELEVFSRLEVEWSGETPPEDERGGLAAAGFVLSDETLEALRAIDVSKLDLGELTGGRALLLERDGLPVDERLRAALAAAGADVEVSPAEGFGRMMDDPRWAKEPRAVFETVGRWLAEASSPAAQAPASESVLETTGPQVAPELELVVDGKRIRETPLLLEVAGERLFAVLTEPADGPSAQLCAVLLNAGPVRRIGPNRMWVEASRRWGAAGVPTIRVDMDGLGDSDGRAARYGSDRGYYEPELIDITLALLDELERRGLPGNFLLAGLCSGAYWSLHAALHDRRVRAAYLLNLWSFSWTRSLLLDRQSLIARERLSKRQHLRWVAVMLGIWLLRRPTLAFRVSRRRRLVERALERIAAQGTQLTLGFSSREPLLADLEAWRLQPRHDLIQVERFATGDHTLRAPAYQRQLHASLDAALARALSRNAAPAQEAGRVT